MLRVSYILHEHGWATASLESDETTLDLDVSFLSDGLGDLARAARGILRGLPEASARLQQEPGEHRVVMTRDGNNVLVSVHRFADNFSRRQSGTVVLVARCSVRELVTAIINCLRRVLDEHGEAGYRQRWRNHDFPIQEYRDLLDLRRNLEDAP